MWWLLRFLLRIFVTNLCFSLLDEMTVRNLFSFVLIEDQSVSSLENKFIFALFVREQVDLQLFKHVFLFTYYMYSSDFRIFIFPINAWKSTVYPPVFLSSFIPNKRLIRFFRNSPFVSGIYKFTLFYFVNKHENARRTMNMNALKFHEIYFTSQRIRAEQRPASTFKGQPITFQSLGV